MIFPRRLLLTALLGWGLPAGCRLERSDAAAQAAAILHKRPSDFIDQLSALDALARRETQAGASAARPTLAESLYHYRTRLQPLLATAPADSEKADILIAWVFDSLRVQAVADSGDLAASLPSEVLRRRRGSCLGISLVFLALGRTLELPVFPVFLPGHVFVRYRSGAYARNMETLRGGLARSDSFYRERFSLARRPWYALQEGDARQALGALVFNLGNTHRRGGNRMAALDEYRLAAESMPGFPEALGNQGAVRLETGDETGAERLLLAALAGDSLAAPAWKNLARIYRNRGDLLKEAWARERMPRGGQDTGGASAAP